MKRRKQEREIEIEGRRDEERKGQEEKRMKKM